MVPKWFSSLPLQVKAALIFVITAVVWLIPVHFAMSLAQRSLSQVAETDRAFHLLRDVRLWENLVVWSDSRMPAFHTGTSEHLAMHGQALSDLFGQLERVRQVAPAEDFGKIQNMESYLQEYRAAFTSLADGLRRQGYKDWGLEGRWRTAAHELEAAFLQPRSPLYVDVLQMRRNEKDYLLRHEEQYAQIVESYVESLRRKTQATGGSEAPLLLSRLAEYRAAFAEFRKIEQELGVQTGQGLLGRVRQARRALEPEFESFISDAWEARRRQIVWFFPFLYGTGPALGLLAALAFVLLSHTYRQQLALQRAEENRKASEAKSRFLAGVSHELRNPLAAIIGFGDLLEEQASQRLNEKERRHVEHIRSSSRHMLGLVNDILDLSRIEAGKIQLRRTLVEFRGILQEVMPTVETMAAEKRLQIKTNPNLNVEVYADPLRFKQILLNLLGNAVKFTPAGGSVEVGVKSSNGTACLFVRDNGPGIRSEDQPRIFEEFFRGQHERDDSIRGTGLGLAITRRLVEQHGGKIWLQSEPGKGTEFFFTLPQTAPVQ